MSDDPQFESTDARLSELEKKVNRGEELSADEQDELERIVSKFQDEASTSIGDINKRASEKADDLHSEYDAKLAELEKKAREARGRESVKIASKDAMLKSDAEAARGLGVGLSIAYTILGVPLVGLAIGWALDSHYQSNVFKGLGTVSGAVLGIILAFWMMNRQNN